MAKTITVSDSLALRIATRVQDGPYRNDNEVLEAALDFVDTAEHAAEELSPELIESIRQAMDDPGPNLTTDEVRQSILGLHDAALQRHGKA